MPGYCCTHISCFFGFLKYTFLNLFSAIQLFHIIVLLCFALILLFPNICLFSSVLSYISRALTENYTEKSTPNIGLFWHFECFVERCFVLWSFSEPSNARNVLEKQEDLDRRMMSPSHLTSTVTKPQRPVQVPVHLPYSLLIHHPSIHPSVRGCGGTQHSQQTWATVRLSLPLRGPLSKFSKIPVRACRATPTQS